MNISDALKCVQWDKAEYFKYKFPEAKYDQSKKAKTEEEFLKTVGKKTMNTYYRWEKTPEYKALVALLLQSKVANDLDEIYNAVTENAKTGDDKAVKLFLQLSKEIDNVVKASQAIINVKETDDEDDDLILEL